MIRYIVVIAKKVGPFSDVIRPFTVNGRQTLCFVNVNGLLGFEVGDLNTGKMLHRVEVRGYSQGPVKRARMSESWDRALTRRVGAVAGGRSQQSRAYLRRDVDATETARQHPAARSARMDHVQPRRPLRLSVDWRHHRHEDQTDRGRTDR
jgi:hypothetical protein